VAQEASPHAVFADRAAASIARRSRLAGDAGRDGMTMPSIVADSITQLPPGCSGKAVIAASHGGLYSAHCVLAAAVEGAIFCDAGIGRERAGVAGLSFLDQHQIPAAAIGHASARIGDGADCMSRGILTVVNDAARRIGIRTGMPASDAAAMLQAALDRRDLRTLAFASEVMEARSTIIPRHSRDPSVRREAQFAPDQVRFEIEDFLPVPVVAIDSNSLVSERDSRSIVLTGSHGGLLGGRSDRAIKNRVFAVVYNDADVGADGAGISRLGALDELEIPAATVSAWSARIGDGRSTYLDGFITHLNRSAIALGGERGISSRAFVARLAEAWVKGKRSDQ
jgi:hypothetical protein